MFPDITPYISPEERDIIASLTTPAAIQAFLDSISYAGENSNRSVARVLRDRRAHCLDGGLLAAAALRWIGERPVVVDIYPNPGEDDDHVLAIYTRNGRFGAVAKSNFVGLRFREPVYRSIRELVMSYFESYFNVHGERTLRSYALPLDLSRYDHLEWLWKDSGVDALEEILKHRRRIPLITSEMAATLQKVDLRSYEAGMMGTDLAGLYVPVHPASQES